MNQFHATPSDDVRRDQLRAGHAMGETAGEYHRPAARRIEVRPQHTTPKKTSAAPKGHEAFLKALETSGTDVKVEKKSSGDILIGKIKHSDKYTVTLQVPAAPGEAGGPAGYVNRVIFKHDISEFSALQARPEVMAAPDAVQ